MICFRYVICRKYLGGHVVSRLGVLYLLRALYLINQFTYRHSVLVSLFIYLVYLNQYCRPKRHFPSD